MRATRRQILLTGIGAGLGALLSGCQRAASTAGLPAVPWPRTHARPEPDRAAYRRPRQTTPVRPAEDRPDGVLPRSQWAQSGYIPNRVDPMRGIRHLTVHHEGASPVYFTDYRASADRLALIQRQHFDRGWGDIGYHFVIDRAGRIWEARPLHLQGAHVRDHNEHNIGVMVLGNFEQQKPADAQLQTLASLVQDLSRRYNLSNRVIHTHRELTPTACPGRWLQPRVDHMRSGGIFA